MTNDFGLGVLLEAKDLFSGTFNNAGAAFKDFAGASSEAGKKTTDNLKLLGVGMGIFAAGIGGLAMLAAPIAAARDYGAQLANIHTIVDEVTFSTKDVMDATMELAGAYGISGLKGAESLYEVISAGVTDTAKATDLLNVASRAAVGGSAELKSVIDVLTSSVNAYGDTGLTAAQASDSLFMAVSAGKTDMAALSQSLGEVAPTAHALGVSFDEMNASIATLTVLGIKTPQAVTGLNAMLANISKPSSDATKEAKRLGIQFDATALKTLGLSGVLKQLDGNAKVNNDTFGNLFGSIDGIKSALTLTAGGGAKFAEVMAMMDAKAGATDKAFGVMSQTLKFQEDRFGALKDNAMILIGQALEPMAASVVKVASAVVEAFNTMPEGMRDFLVQAFAVTAAVTALVGAAVGAYAAWGTLGAALKGVGITLSVVAEAALPVIAVIGALVLTFVAFKQAYEQNLGGFGDFVNGILSTVGLAWEGLKQAFSEGGFSGAVKEQLDKAENSGIKNFVIRLFVTAERIKAFFSSLGEGVSGVFDKAGPSFEAFGAAVSRIGALFSGLWEGLDATDAASTFDSVAAAGAAVGGVLGRVGTAIVNIATVALDFVGGVASTALGPIKSLLGAVWDTLGEVFGVIGEVVGELGIFDSAVDGSESGWVAFGKTIGDIIGVAADLIKSLVKTIGGALKGAINIIGGVLEIFSGNWEKGIQRVLYGIVSLIGSVILGAIELVATASDALFGTDWAGKVGEWRKGLDESLRSGFNIGRKDAAEEPAPGETPIATPGGEPLVSMPEPNASTAGAVSVPPAGVDQTQLFATIAAATAQTKQPPPQNINFVAKLNVDGQELASIMENAQSSRADQTFSPGIPVAS